MALYRAQILLEEAQHDKLETLARESGRSMSDLVRTIMAEYLTRASDEESLRQSLDALDKLSGLRRDIEDRSGRLTAAFLDELREERDAEIGQ
jgi:Ribbon-helix-helix protein, copG family